MNRSLWKSKKQIGSVIILLSSIIVISSCSKKFSESQLSSRQELLTEKRKLNDSLSKAREDNKTDTDRGYLAHFENGKRAHNQGDFTEAIRLFGECVRENPEFGDGWGFRGLSKFKSGDSQGACQDWNNAVQLGASKYQSLLNDNCN